MEYSAIPHANTLNLEGEQMLNMSVSLCVSMLILAFSSKHCWALSAASQVQQT